ncbi:MAG: hypothetical protein ACM34A_17085 [Bacillota bacterium]
MKELIMCYRIPAGAEKDVSTLSSVKESVFTPREDTTASAVSDLPRVSESGFAGMLHKVLAPFSKGKGDISQKDDIEMKPSADTREVEKID